MIGRRVDTIAKITQAGDYAFVEGYTGDKPAVFFIPPNCTPESLGSWPHGRLHHVTSPPHEFRHCDDGSIEVRESIGCLPTDGTEGYSWHGYLDEGHSWREV